MPDITRSTTVEKIKMYIDSAIEINWCNKGNPIEAGMAKVIETQLNFSTILELSGLRSASLVTLAIRFLEILMPFYYRTKNSCIDWQTSKCGWRRMYRMLIAASPDLASM